MNARPLRTFARKVGLGTALALALLAVLHHKP